MNFGKRTAAFKITGLRGFCAGPVDYRSVQKRRILLRKIARAAVESPLQHLLLTATTFFSQAQLGNFNFTFFFIDKFDTGATNKHT